MKLNLVVLCCVIHTITAYSANFSDLISYPPDVSSTRIVGGEDAPDGAAPFQCSIQRFRNHFCGCSILSKKWIVTAAHCAQGQLSSSLEVLVGTNDLRSGGTFYKVEIAKIHKQHNRPAFANDIAVLRVKGTIEMNEKVQPIELETEEVPDGTTLQLTGWGRIRAGGRLPNLLQIITLKAVSTERCRDIYQGRNVHDSHLCTYNKRGEGACNGDSGGPLVWNNKLVGVVNWGVPCAMGFPDAFAKISYLYDWVKENAQ